MNLETRVDETLFKVVDEVNQLLPREAHLEKSMEESLTGPQAKIDSLGLINFILTSEKMVQEEFGKRIILTDGAALIKSDDITLTIGTVKNYICKRLVKKEDE